jgi:hypothetical protein
MDISKIFKIEVSIFKRKYFMILFIIYSKTKNIMKLD